MNDFSRLAERLASLPLALGDLRPLVALLAAVFGGLFVLAVVARLEVTSLSASGRALAAYRTDAVDTPLERLGAFLLRRLPALGSLLAVEQNRRWLALDAAAPPWSVPATVGLAALLALGGALLWAGSGVPALIVAPVIGFLAPFVRQRSRSQKVQRRVQNNLPDLSAMLAAEMAAGNPPDRALERAAELGGPLARILQLALAEQRATGRPLFGRGRVPGVLLEVAWRYPLPALRAFVAQIDMAATTGAAGPELMSGLAHTLIVEYKDRSLREAEALDSRLAVPSVGFFFLPFLFLILVPLMLPVLNAL
jgi:Flp pilus assembly protein TadB